MIMKRNNINTIRTAHYPDDSYLYYLANKYGLMVQLGIRCQERRRKPKHGSGNAL